MAADFWITNISDHLISLGDLGVLIRPYQSINLLDPKHYQLTQEQINSSLFSGSLYKRSDKIKVRKNPPNLTKLKGPSPIDFEQTNDFPSKIRSIIKFQEFNHEDYQISDDEYAKQNAELAEEDDLGRFKK